jgi:hypothetical protein
MSDVGLIIATENGSHVRAAVIATAIPPGVAQGRKSETSCTPTFFGSTRGVRESRFSSLGVAPYIATSYAVLIEQTKSMESVNEYKIKRNIRCDLSKSDKKTTHTKMQSYLSHLFRVYEAHIDCTFCAN